VTITPFDDYPVHQTVQPIAHPVSGDPNHYDRYWFNGFSVDGEWFFGIAMGVYPNRGIIDAAFSFLLDGTQRSVFASGRAPVDRAHTAVGSIAIEVVQPLSTNVVRVNAAHLGMEAELRWRPRTIALEEPRQTFVDGLRTTLDSTRFTQWGVWDGWVNADGQRVEVSGAATRGTKDRSWGIRGVGDQVTSAPSTRVPGVFFSWAPTHFDDRCTHVMLFDRPDGTHSHISAVTVPLLGEGAPPFGDEDGVERAEHLTASYTWRPGTRRVKQAVFDFDYGSRTEQLIYEPLLDFQMKGIGYFHPEWGHGRWHGELAEGSDEWRIEDLDPLNITNIHIQSLCRVTSADGRTGIGSLEQLAIGAHASGLTGLLDGAP
jgi:hypothetical protein